MIIFDVCSEDQRDLNSHEQYFLLDTLHLLVGENAPGRRAALPSGGPGSLLATVSQSTKTEDVLTLLSPDLFSLQGGLRGLLHHEVHQQSH